MLRRRLLATSALSLGLLTLIKSAVAGLVTPSKSPRKPPTIIGNTGNAVVGAIRWDAWQHPTLDTVRVAVQTDLGPATYHWRAPFFSIETGANALTISGDQAAMDAEIAYAVEAGLNYWAFVWYSANHVNGMQNGWQLFQSSTHKTDINWCLYYAGTVVFHDEITNNLTDNVGYMSQANYQKVLTNRPLVYVLDDGSSRATLAADITALRAAVVTAGLGTPYIGWGQNVLNASELATYGFDAATHYAVGGAVGTPTPYRLLDAIARNAWADAGALAIDVIPLGMLGWDRRPRVENPVPWQAPTGTLAQYYYYEYSDDPAVHLDAMLAWMRANSARVPANVAIIYAWNEHDEGGWACPTLIPGTLGQINRSQIDAIAAVLQ